MGRKQHTVTAPICPACSVTARLTDGVEVYPRRPDLHDKLIWKCDGCSGYVGCHPGITKPLGTPAGYELRQARSKLHDLMIDPIWKNAWRDPAYEATEPSAEIAGAARTRVYRFLADKLGISGAECHTAMLTIEQCRDAWRALKGVTYSEIREWSKAQKSKREVA